METLNSPTPPKPEPKMEPARVNPPHAGLEFEDDDESVNIIEWVRVLIRHWRMLFGVVAGLVGLISIAVLRMDDIYAAETTILPPETGSALQLGAPDPLMLLMGRGQSPSALWLGILDSDAVRDRILEALKLWPDLPQYKRRNRLRLMLTADVDKKSNIISVIVEHTDPKIASDVANRFVFELDHFLREVKRSGGARTRTFVESRLNEARDGLRKAEDSVKDFQTRNGAIELRSQTSAVLQAIAAVKGQLMSKEIELRTIMAWANSDHPKVTLLQNQIGGLRAQLKNLEGGTNSGTFIASEKLPELSLEYARLLREVTVQENINRVLAEQFEVARIHEASDTQTVTVLDKAEPPVFAKKPQRAIIIALSTIIAMFIGAMVVITQELGRRGKLPSLSDPKKASA